MIKKIRHITEFVFIKFLFFLFGILPINTASSIAGCIGRLIGPRLKVTKVARKNITNALAQLKKDEVDEIIIKMWENLGRVIGEFPHMRKFKGEDSSKIITIENVDIIKKIAKSDKSVIYFSGHFANWEIIPKSVFEAGCTNINTVYRKSNNPYIDKLIIDVRSNYQKGCMPKGPIGARKIIRAIKNGEHIGMLVDQKQNDGIAVPFFGRDAMTAPAMANLALKLNCQLVPIEIKREVGAKFKVKIHKPITLKNTGDNEKDVFTAMKKVNSILEGWIKDRPEQWFWVHNRWPK